MTIIQSKKEIFAAGIDVRIVRWFLKLIMFFLIALKRSGFLSNVNNGVFFSHFLGADKAFWLSQILRLFPIVTVLGGWLLAIHMKQPCVFPEDKIQHCENCKCQSKLIRGRGWMFCAFLTHVSFWKRDVGFF